MSFFHIFVSTNHNSDSFIEISIDLSQEELLAKFVKPYKEGNDLVLKNKVLRLSNINTIHIVKTARNNEDTRQEINRRDLERIDKMNREPGNFVLISAGRGYETLDILDGGEDVTADFIKGPPGYGSSAVSKKLVVNPWVVGIGTAIIAGIVLALLT